MKNKLAVISLCLVLPALFLCTSGILFVAFKMEAANRLLELVQGTAAGKLFLSSFTVLGGVIAALGLNVWKVFHLSTELINEEFVIAISIKRMAAHLAYVALAGALLLLLLTCAFVENFQIVHR